MWPILAGFSRLVIASVGGWLAIHWFGGGLTALFGVMALALVVFGITVTGAVTIRRVASGDAPSRGPRLACAWRCSGGIGGYYGEGVRPVTL